MNKVVTINLNGRAYQLEEAGYADLKRYLEQASERLADDPDKDEIVADLEQAVAEKCDQVLTNGKTVVSEKEIVAIIKQMGPVKEGPDDEAEAESDQKKSAKPKRFYLVKEGSMIGGVATGLAAYFNLDVTVVRLALVLIAFITNGFGVLAYLVAMIVAPTADTPEKKAEARGESFDSQALIESARRKYREMSEGDEPALARLGEVIRVILRVFAGIIAVIAFITLFSVMIAGLSVFWSVIFGGGTWLAGVLGTTSTWMVGLFLLSGVAVILIPVGIIASLSSQYAKDGRVKERGWVLVAAAALFALAVSAFVSLPASSPALRESIQSFGEKVESGSFDGFCIGVCAE